MKRHLEGGNSTSPPRKRPAKNQIAKDWSFHEAEQWYRSFIQKLQKNVISPSLDDSFPTYLDCMEVMLNKAESDQQKINWLSQFVADVNCFFSNTRGHYLPGGDLAWFDPPKISLSTVLFFEEREKTFKYKSIFKVLWGFVTDSAYSEYHRELEKRKLRQLSENTDTFIKSFTGALCSPFPSLIQDITIDIASLLETRDLILLSQVSKGVFPFVWKHMIRTVKCGTYMWYLMERCSNITSFQGGRLMPICHYTMKANPLKRFNQLKTFDLREYPTYFNYRLLEKCTQLTELDIGNVDKYDSFANFLKKMINLKSFRMTGTLNMRSSEKDGNEKEEFVDLPFHFLTQLSSLSIRACVLSAATLQSISTLNLTNLEIEYCSSIGSLVEPISLITSLTSLVIKSNSLTEESLLSLKTLSNLKDLCVGGQITKQAIDNLKLELQNTEVKFLGFGYDFYS